VKNLNIKAKVLGSYFLSAYIIFLPGVIKELSGHKLVQYKFGILILGSLCGFGLHKALLTITSKREKLKFIFLLSAMVTLLGISLNL
jgi:hypothetical protein